jgi:segregation and condensation protein B
VTDETREEAAAQEPAAVEATPAAEAGADAVAAAPRDPRLLMDILEALVFVHRGILPPKTVREVIGEEEFSAAEIDVAFEALREEYERRGGAVRLLAVAGGWQLGTRPDLADWIQRLDFYEHHRHLSRPTLETLAIIAYRQPVTRAEIEAIRGVNAERIVRNLLEKKLVKILGHKDVPGKPMVVGTTRDFLQLFGLNSLADLPPLKEFMDRPATEEGEDAPIVPLPEEEPDDAGREAEPADQAEQADAGRELAGGGDAPADAGAVGPEAGEEEPGG